MSALEDLYAKLSMSPRTAHLVDIIRKAVEADREGRNVDVRKLREVADEMSEWTSVPPYKRAPAISVDYLSRWGKMIRAAIEGAEVEKAKPQLPEGIEWPRFEDGELVMFGDEFADGSGDVDELRHVHFYDDEVYLNSDFKIKYGEPVKRPQPEVLDADGVPIKVGDTVYSDGGMFTNEFVVMGFDNALRVIAESQTINEGMIAYGCDFTHRKPDTQEDIDADMALNSWDYLKKYGMMPVKTEGETKKEFKLRVRLAHRGHILARQRKVLGGE